ncbi:MAG: TrkA family potassium uptake protein [Cellulomonadaceae bacterium]|nr:TrkA family potassium uptake protein [Cellulomonadaceae bacterium]
MADRRKRRNRDRNDSVLVVGLGRFGTAIATALDKLGQDVLVVERDPDIINTWSGRLDLVQADATNSDALEQLGAADFEVAVVGIGGSLEQSVLATSNLADLGVKQIWAKAISEKHGIILERIGAHHVIYPEWESGSRVAHLLSGKLLDYIDVEDGFTIVKIRPPVEIQGFTLAELNLRQRFGITIIGVKSPGKEFVYATQHTVVAAEDIIVCSGHADKLEDFAALA